MTKRREATQQEGYMMVPIGDDGIKGHALLDTSDYVWLSKFCGNTLAFILKNGYVYVKWKGEHKSVVRMILNARDCDRIKYAEGGPLDLRRSNVSKVEVKTPTVHTSTKMTERNRRKRRRARGVLGLSSDNSIYTNGRAIASQRREAKDAGLKILKNSTFRKTLKALD